MKKYKKIFIEITNICNMKCNFCPETKRQLKYMNKEDFAHVIEEVKPFANHIYFHLMGEPLLNPEIGSFLEICYKNGLKVNITTNGTLLNRVKDVLLKAPALRKVSISLHSFEANEGTANLEEYIADVMRFVKEASGKGIFCELRLWNRNSEGIQASNRLNLDIIDMLKQSLQLNFSLEAALEQRNNIKLQNNLFIQLADKFEWPNIDRDIVDEEVFCYGLRDQFGVLVDGTVVPCCLDNEGNIALGNIFEQPIYEILNSDRARRMYDGFTGRLAVEELCKKCGFAKRHKRS
ncbi:MAG TPA: radical SAM/SPASM domain-containing protein [Ruminiclostridium sp.]